MWKYIGNGESIAGVPLGPEMPECSDEEWDDAEARYDAQFSDDQRGSLRTCGLYEHVAVADKKPKPVPASEEE